MPSNTSRLARAKIALLAENSAALSNNVTSLQGEDGLYRLRIGDWRVIFTETSTSIEIEKIAPRGSAYE